MSEITHDLPGGKSCETMFSRTNCFGSPSWSASFRSSSSATAAFDTHRLAEPKLRSSEGWWSQTGSNRRPHACKARALPAELWPQFLRRARLRWSYCAQQPSSKKACRAEAAEQRRLVGLGRLELPTSRLSSARSNQLSYKPLHEGLRRVDAHAYGRLSLAPAAIAQRAKPLAHVRPRRKRNEDGEIPPMELNNPKTVGP